MNERLCIEEVGVDLELCVHAHGPDVELIMEAARKNNYPLVIRSFGIRGLIIYDCGSDHMFLIPFPGQVRVLAFCRSIRLPNLYFDLPSLYYPHGISRIYLMNF